MVKEKKFKVKSNGPYTIKTKDFVYKFETGETKEVQKEHLDVLLDTGLLEEVK